MVFIVVEFVEEIDECKESLAATARAKDFAVTGLPCRAAKRKQERESIGNVTVTCSNSRNTRSLCCSGIAGGRKGIRVSACHKLPLHLQLLR